MHTYSYVVNNQEIGICVGRKGTNQFCLVERYLDVLVKHTTVDFASDLLWWKVYCYVDLF